MPDRIDRPGGAGGGKARVAGQREDGDAAPDCVLVLGVAPQPPGDDGADPAGQSGFGDRGCVFLHPPVGQVAERFDHLGAAAGEQHLGVVGGLADIREAVAQAAQGPAVEGHMRQHRVDGCIAFGTAFGYRHHRWASRACWAAASSARVSSSLNPNNRKSVTRMV